jgi:CheY-like chemotaxis protein
MKKVVAIVSDLMFMAKIQDAARRAGLDPVFVKTPQDALDRAREHPAVIIIDLNNAAAEPLETIQKLKTNPQTQSIKLVGFVSHVQAELRHAAEEKGCDVVVARSAFSQNLPAILSQSV